MASFMVHIDKENETPAALAHKGPVKAFGPRSKYFFMLSWFI